MPEMIDVIRDKVREHLTSSEAFNALSPEQRKAIAHDTVKALTYIMGGEDGTSLPSSIALGGNTASFAGPVQPIRRVATQTPQHQPQQSQQSQQRPSRAQFVEDAGEAYAKTVERINFPKFVGGLIDGVFNSIVTTSIKQMEAYAEMVKNVSKSVDQYMKDNVSENHARDYLLDRYPDQFEPNMGGDKPTLKAKQGADEQNMPDFFADLGMKAPVTSLDDDTVEQELVPAARRRIAMDRQQLLATMIMMGINRLVVTDGRIEASCMFELNVKQKDDRSRESTGDYGTHHEDGSNRGYSGSDQYDYKQEGSSGGWFSSATPEKKYTRSNSWYSNDSSANTADFHMTTINKQSKERDIDMHAKLSGKVTVNFKSDYFPMEKMIDVFQVSKIEEKTAIAVNKAQSPKANAPALPAPALPPMPALPAPAR